MDNRRALILAGLLVLIMLGAGVAWLIVTSSGPAPAPNAVADDGISERPHTSRAQPRSRPDAAERAPQQAAAQEHAGDAVAHSRAAELRAATMAEFVIRGRALNYFEEGAPGVTLTLLKEGDDAASGPSATTGADGAFEFSARLQDEAAYFVACLDPSRALTATPSFVVRQGEDVDGLIIRIFEAARVHGVVLNADDNQPLEGVTVRLDARSDERLQRLGRLLGRFRPARSDDRGRYEVAGIAPGSYLVYAEKPGWTASEMDPLTRNRQEVALDEYANVELMPFLLIEGGSIEGRVMKAADRAPIPGAMVELGTPLGGAIATTTTDDDGRYRFDSVPPTAPGAPGDMGGLTVRAIAPGFAIASRNFNLQRGATRGGINLLLGDGCAVRGRVLDAGQSPVAGARVYYNDNDMLRGGELVQGVSIPRRTISTTTNERGEFELQGLPAGSIAVNASAEGFANGEAQATTAPGETAEVLIVLQPEGWIEGIVTNERGAPVAGVALAAYDVSGPGELAFVMRSLFGETLPDRGESTLFSSPIRSDEEGRYRISALAAARYAVVANTRSYQKYISAELEVSAGRGTVHNIRLESGGVIYGRVFDGFGVPVSGAAITAANLLGQDTMRIRTSYTDRNGNYEITGLSPGSYTVVRNDGNMARLFLPTTASRVVVKAGERTLFDIYEQKPGTARLFGRVTLDGEPYRNESLALYGGGRRGFSADTTTTDAEGNYEFRSVPLGVYQVARSIGPGPSLVRLRVYVDREGDFEFDVNFQTVKLSGRVVVEGGEVPQGRVRVIASPVPASGADAGADAMHELELLVASEARVNSETGEFELSGLSPGYYRISARSEHNGMVTRPFVNLRVSVSGYLITLPREGATLSGTVTGLDGAQNNTPFGLIAALTIEDDSGLPLALGGFDAGVNLTETRAFTLNNLPEGRFTVTLSLTGYTPVTHVVQLKTGETTSLTFAFASSGDLRIQLANQDLDIQSALALEYEIRNSKGELFKKRFTFLDFFTPDGGAAQGDDNSFTIKDLPPESYTISLSMPGFRPVSRQFTIVAGETAEVSVEFVPE
jgi:large repetitive protein